MLQACLCACEGAAGIYLGAGSLFRFCHPVGEEGSGPAFSRKWRLAVASTRGFSGFLWGPMTRVQEEPPRCIGSAENLGSFQNPEDKPLN